MVPPDAHGKEPLQEAPHFVDTMPMHPHQWPAALRFALGAVFGILALFSLLCIAFSFDDGLITGLFLALFFFGVGAGCAWIAYALIRPLVRERSSPPAGRRLAAASASTLEHCILELAAALGRPLTVAEVALRCNVSIEQSKEALSALVRAGVADVALDERNDMVYAINALRRDGA